MSKLIQTFIIAILIGIATDVSGQAYKSSVGVRLGTFFTGSYKTFINDNSALEGIVGIDSYSTGLGSSKSSLIVGGFYKLHNDLEIEGQPLQWYYGVGGYVLLGDFTGIGPSGIVGLEYTLTDSRVNFFIDAIPTLFIGNGATDLDINASLGARYILN